MVKEMRATIDEREVLADSTNSKSAEIVNKVGQIKRYIIWFRTTPEG